MALASVSEIPAQDFTEAERVRLREMLVAFEGISNAEIQEIKRLTHSTRTARTALIIIGRTVAYISGLLTMGVLLKQWWKT